MRELRTPDGVEEGPLRHVLRVLGYPDCKTTKQIGGTQTKDVPLDEKCPQCDNNLVMKNGRFGEFTACSNYPTCKYVKQKTIGVKCPECSEGEIIERRSKKGKTFYGCNRYPDCTFVAWGKPVPEKCPECGSPYMVEKFVKAGAFWQCPNAECKHKVEVPGWWLARSEICPWANRGQTANFRQRASEIHVSPALWLPVNAELTKP